MYNPPRICRIKIHGSDKIISNAVLATDTMQLPGFLSIKAKVNGIDATRFIALGAIEEMIVENEELLKTIPCGFVPEARLKVQKDDTL